MDHQHRHQSKPQNHCYRPPPPPTPTLSGAVKPVSASPGPSSSSVKTTKSPVSNAFGSHTDALLNAIKNRNLKPIPKKDPQENTDTNDLEGVFKRALREKFKNARGDEDEPKEGVNSKCLEDWPEQIETGAEKTKVVNDEQHNLTDDIKAQHQKTTNTYGRFFSNPHSSKTEEIQPSNGHSCTL